MDVFVADPTVFITALVKEGFNEIKSPNSHEYSTLIKETIEIDLHRYFPVLSYPKDLMKESYNKSEFITKDSIQDIIIEIIELSEDQNFNGNEFERLIKKYQAFESIAFVDNFINELIGKRIFGKYTASNYLVYPQLLYWNFNTWVIPDKITDVIMVDSLEKVTLNMRSTKIHLRSSEVTTYSNKSKSNALIGIEKNTSGFSPKISFSVKLKNALLLIVKVTTTLSIMNDIIHINTGKIRRTLFGSKIEHINKDLYEYIPDITGYTVIFKISEEELPEMTTIDNINEALLYTPQTWTNRKKLIKQLDFPSIKSLQKLNIDYDKLS